jgi:hypothetical protein
MAGSSSIMWVAYTNPPSTIVTSGLKINLDPATYSGSGASWVDTSSTGATCTLIGSPTYNSAGAGSNFVLNGTSQAVSIPTSVSSMTDMYVGGFTYSMWVKIPTIAAEIPFITKGDGGATQGQRLVMAINSGAKFIGVLDSSGNSIEHTIDPTTPIPANTWLYITLTYAGGSWAGVCSNSHLYVNGVEYGSTSGTSVTYQDATGTKASDSTALTYLGYSAFTDFFTFGSRAARYGSFTLGQTLLYNRLLTSTELTTNFTATRANYGV